MISDVLKIIPKLDTSALRKMEKTMQTRFTRIAKRFGGGLTKALKSGALLGAATALIGRLLNPLKETDEAIKNTLTKSDDIATLAGTFNTETGKLYKLISLGRSTGVDQDSLMFVLTKFQTQLAEAQKNPNQPHMLQQFAGEKDTAEAFLQFVQSIQRLDKNQQALIQQRVFGERQILKMADFMQQDFQKLYKNIGLDKVTAQKLTMSIEKMAALSDLEDVLASRREAQDIVRKASLITPSIIRQRDQNERAMLDRENQQIRNYQNLNHLKQTSDLILQKLTEGMGLIGSFIPTVTKQINKLIEFGDKITKSNFMKGIFKWGRGD